ncbi:MAG TPA: hypothetical protein VHR27_15440 [Blastocatellia bacterium]|jgi:hypothetical protein|nr:hypothetical protein [Blastocatellia bacterium]
MQLHGLLDALPLWALLVATLVVALLSFEGGFWVGRRRSLRSELEQEIVVRGLVGGMLGLEAFMLAFTFGAAAAHFDARRQAVLDEANSIRTAYLRADFLPEPHRAEIRNLLREYVDVRLEGVRSGKIEQGIARSEELHNQLWLQATASREKTTSPAFAVQFIQSLNEIFALHSRRVITGLEFRIPNIIWIVLYAITALAAASIGYHSGLTGRSRPLVALAIILAFSAVILLIEDLDRPLYGFLEVSQRALVDLQTKMNAQIR